MPAVEARGGDVWLRVRVQPKASRCMVLYEPSAEQVRVTVTAPPADGLANKMVCDALAKRLGLPKSRVRLEKGSRSRDKVVVAEAVALDEVLKRLATLPA
ncbi:MAG: hypothetical protein GC168_04670 [Candidatus Hydrogenedens sp.]|nr:hypothetical protein [Candidatus Hydrogenedens sp.]